MKARIMLDNAPFGPEDLEIARRAFDSLVNDCRAVRHRLCRGSA
jgi:hypothetical protein